ncbi:hypothetical protein BgiBS90_023202 [Biomphalaria glabrata]|nr:hypothetical protein BgiBS90_023202 [Biomphalaria glabrata]
MENNEGYVLMENNEGYVLMENNEGYVLMENNEGYVLMENNEGYVLMENSQQMLPVMSPYFNLEPNTHRLQSTGSLLSEAEHQGAGKRGGNHSEKSTSINVQFIGQTYSVHRPDLFSS